MRKTHLLFAAGALSLASAISAAPPPSDSPFMLVQAQPAAAVPGPQAVLLTGGSAFGLALEQLAPRRGDFG